MIPFGGWVCWCGGFDLEVLAEFNTKYDCDLSLPDTCRDHLFNYDWPGNVRELQNVIKYAAGLSIGEDCVSTELLLEGLRGGSVSRGPDLDFKFDPLRMSWEEVESRLKTVYFRKLLAGADSTKEAMEISGFSKARFYEIKKALGL